MISKLKSKSDNKMADNISSIDNSSKKEKTVGQASYEILSKKQDAQPVIDTQREMLKGYYDELIKAVYSGIEQYGSEKPFYICVHTRRERTMVNVIRNLFHPRQTRPSPTYDLALYWYDPKTEQLSFVWCIPDKQTVEDLIANEIYLDKEHLPLLGFCKSFIAGTLI